MPSILGVRSSALEAYPRKPQSATPSPRGRRGAGVSPQNPIGDRWIGLEGVGEYAALSGYGFHGTIEPENVGGEGSLGCVRMLPDDVGLLYELLSEGRSVVEIRP